MTIIDILTTILSVMIEGLVLTYYSQSIMTCRYSKTQSNVVIAVGYVLYCLICSMEIPAFNLVAFIIITFAVLRIGFSEEIRDVTVKTLILTALMMSGELVVALVFRLDLNDSYYYNVTLIGDFIFVMASKLIYSILVLMLKSITTKHEKVYHRKLWGCILALPIVTLILLHCLGNICSMLNDRLALVLSVTVVLLILSNFIVYFTYDMAIDGLIKSEENESIRHKDELDYECYMLMKQKYSELKLLVHDFEKYCKNIEGMLNKDQLEALSLVNDIESKNKEFLLVEYTNNKALNILLSQKMEKCNKLKMDFRIYIKDVDLSFFDETDIVAIFANLMDNAIEGCQESAAKQIFLSIYTMNDAYIVIRVDNSADKEPILRNGMLQSRKKDKEFHGLGVVSIKKALRRYNGHLRWSYDKETKLFNTIIMISRYSNLEKE